MKPEAGVRQHVDEDASGSARDHGSEQRIVQSADDHLNTSWNHLLHEHGGHVRAKPGSKILVRRFDIRGGCEIQADRAAFGLVQQAGPSALSATG